jgi:cob(I)alamin adenosyltransferase
VDELNSCLGLVLSHTEDQDSAKAIFQIQNHLFLIGSFLSCDQEDLAKTLTPMEESMIQDLETEMDKMQENLAELKNFILPGGSHGAGFAHLARCVCRRAERHVVHCDEEILYKEEIIKYLNRLSDYLFVLSRHLNQSDGKKDVVWDSSLFKK